MCPAGLHGNQKGRGIMTIKYRHRYFCYPCMKSKHALKSLVGNCWRVVITISTAVKRNVNIHSARTKVAVDLISEQPNVYIM